MNHVNFAHPSWLWIGALVCLAVAMVMVRADHLRRRAGTLLAGAHAVVTVARGRRLAKRALVLLGTACAFAALARPRWGYRWESERRTGVDLMFAVDTSKSMGARDLAPDRLTRAKLAVADLLREFPGERAGLIAFAGTAFVEAPMTLDQAMFTASLDALDTGIIPRGGTNIAAAIHSATAAMASEPDHRKVLVILSDGENLQGDALAAAHAAARAGLVIYTVGVGTPAGELVPANPTGTAGGRSGSSGVLLDAVGQPVRSRLDEPMLRRLAAATGGAYAALGPSGRGLETLYRQHLAALPRRASEERTHKIWTERFQIPLGAALVCLLLDVALGERRRRRRRRAHGGTAVGAAAALVLLVGAPRLAAAAPAPAVPHAAAHGQTGTYNQGTAAYRKRDYEAAKKGFESATHTTDLGLQEDAYYDLGNTRYRVGQAALQKGPDQSAAIASWKQALAAYDGALALQPKDGDAKFNRDLVARRLAALEQQQQQQQKQQNQQNQNQQKQQKQQKQQSQGQSAQNQSGGGKQNQNQNQKGAGHDQSAQNQSGGAQQQNGGHDGKPQTPPQQAGSSGQEQANRAPSQGTGQQHAASSPSQAAQASNAQANPPGPALGQPTPTPKGPGVVAGAANQANPPNGAAPAAAARRAPGELTQGEATQLLDSVSGELQPLPTAGDSRRPASADDEPEKDW